MEPRVSIKAEAKSKVGVRGKSIITALLGLLIVAMGAAVFWYFTRPPARAPVEKASPQQMAFPLPDKPSIAVMPLLNMTGEQNQNFLCDGLSESLITALSKEPHLFDLQDDITMKILTELRVTITGAPRTLTKGTDNLQAHLKVYEGVAYERQGTKEANAEAKRLYQVAIALDPNWAMPYAALASALYKDLFYGASESPKETLSNAMKLAQKAIEVDNSSAEAHAALSGILLGMRQHEKAIEAGERAVTLDPNSYWALSNLAMCLFYAGRSEESLPLSRQAMRLNPFSVGSFRVFALACRETGRYEEGIAT